MKVCSKCKVEKPKTEFSKSVQKKDGLSSNCKACNAAYKAANCEKIAAQRAEYRAVNSGKINAYNAERYAANREALKAYQADYRYANLLAVKARMAKYRAANRQTILEKQAVYRSSNLDRLAANSRNRRARNRSAEGRHTSSDVRAIFEKQNGLCATCQTKLFKSGAKKYHVDHIIPLALGGSNWPDNLQCLCPPCNLSKGAKHPDEWAKQQGKLL